MVFPLLHYINETEAGHVSYTFAREADGRVVMAHTVNIPGHHEEEKLAFHPNGQVSYAKRTYDGDHRIIREDLRAGHNEDAVEHASHMLHAMQQHDMTRHLRGKMEMQDIEGIDQNLRNVPLYLNKIIPAEIDTKHLEDADLLRLNRVLVHRPATAAIGTSMQIQTNGHGGIVLSRESKFPLMHKKQILTLEENGAIQLETLEYDRQGNVRHRKSQSSESVDDVAVFRETYAQLVRRDMALSLHGAMDFQSFNNLTGAMDSAARKMPVQQNRAR